MRAVKRFVYSRGTELPSVIVADAGLDDSVTALEDVLLDGTGSTTSEVGGITSYLWEFISPTPYSFTTPTASTTEVTGFPTNGSFVVRLTVGDGTGNTATDTVTITVAAAVSTLKISSSLPDGNGMGTLNITGGEEVEVINLAFTLQSTQAGDGVDVTDTGGSPLFVGDLDWRNVTRYAQVTLSGGGSFTMLYDGTGSGFSMLSNMVQRSIGTSIPTPSSTTINF